MPITIRPTSADVKIAHAVARHTNWRTERASEALTWGADEHVLCAAALLWWLYSRGQSRQQTAANHILLTTLATTALPHVLKGIFNQRRPDRLTVIGHLHGIPISGKPLDAFPSGHAIHIGAIASAARELPRRQRFAVWGLSGGLLLTRIVLLAHWTSDVAWSRDRSIARTVAAKVHGVWKKVKTAPASAGAVHHLLSVLATFGSCPAPGPFPGDAGAQATSCRPSPSANCCRHPWHIVRTATPRPCAR